MRFPSIRFEFIKKYTTKLTLGTAVLLTLFAFSIYAVSGITYDIIYQEEVETDHAILQYMSANIVNPNLTPVMTYITHLASAPFLQVTYGIIILIYLLRKNYRRSIEIVAIGASGLLINVIMKSSFHRLRPPDPLIEPLQSFSYPSGHATAGFIFYGLVAYLIWKSKLNHKLKIFFGAFLITLALVIGFSRIYLRVHYPSDVASGLAIGLAWLLVLIWYMERSKKKSKEEIAEETGIGSMNASKEPS
jgi:membrane-associated phospholipid phosphatase